jgi:HK97 family phage portal protein
MAELTVTSVSNSLIDDYFPAPEGQDKPSKIPQESFYTWLGKMPEVSGVIGAVCNDIMGDGFEFRGTKAGIAAAQEFVKRNHFNKKFYSALQDYVLLGDSYLGIRIINENYINKTLDKSSIIDDLQKSFGTGRDEIITKLKLRSPDLLYPREVFPLKASTIYPVYDEHGRVEKYVQKVNGNSKKVSFLPNEVIHFSLNNIGNDVFGSSPFASCLNDVATLWYAKDYAGTFFQNDASPDKMYILKNTAPNSAEFETFKRSIEAFKHSKNKHKSMVMTGEVEIQNVNDFNKDLEFSNLLDKFTQRLRMAWNMPGSRMDESKSSSSNKAAEAGYYKNINRMQSEIEETLNNELWARFGDVEMVFKKAYKRDESIEADIVAKLVGKPVLSINEGREYLGYKPDESDPSLDEVAEDFTQNPGGQLPDTKQGEEVGNQHRVAEKMVKRGNVITMDYFRNFVSIVEAGDRTFMTAKVFVSEDEEKYDFVFSDTVGTYECSVPKATIVNEAEFRLKYIDYSMRGKLKNNKIEIEV